MENCSPEASRIFFRPVFQEIQQLAKDTARFATVDLVDDQDKRCFRIL
jgi:hypothetical protein